MEKEIKELIKISENSLIRISKSLEITNKIITDTYKSIQIGNQIWIIDNLNVDRFRNGDLINEAGSMEEWKKASENNISAWCYYGNDLENGRKLGKLYNWSAVNDPRGLAPEGWHIPSKQEWDELSDFLGGVDQAGLKMKNSLGWGEIDNVNNCGFNALPGGFRISLGWFVSLNDFGYWWSNSEYSVEKAWGYNISKESNTLNSSYAPEKGRGLSVRCIKDK